MNTITHIETALPADDATLAWVYCTFALRGERFVAYIAGGQGDGQGNYTVFVSNEDAHHLNRPSDYPLSIASVLGDASLPETLSVKVPCLEDGFGLGAPAAKVQREIEHRLLEAVASAYLHPKAERIVRATVDYVRLCDANKAQSELAKMHCGLIKHFLNQQHREYNTPVMASLGSRRAVHYMMEARHGAN